MPPITLRIPRTRGFVPLLRRVRALPRFAAAGSAAIALLGVIWTLQRVF